MRKKPMSAGCIAAIILTTGTVALLPASAARAAESPAKIVSAIKGGVRFLLSKERPHRLWERKGSHPPWVNDIGGKTALVTEALLDVEQTLRLKRLNIFKPAMKKAINFLVDHQFPTTYYTSFSANALALLPHKAAYRSAIVRDGRFLLRSIGADGGYGYAWGPLPIKRQFTNSGELWDNSNTQYGVLGVWACAHYGIGIPGRYWAVAARHWRIKQHFDGTWGYGQFAGLGSAQRKPAGRAPTFTPAGVASLLICDEFLGAREVGSRPQPDPAVLRGLAWIDKNFPSTTSDTYAMYCYERVGLASGLTEFGGQNWYNDFARTLTAPNAQQGGGWWWANFFGGGHPESAYESQIAGTAYALLILDRGLNPIFMSKLQYGKSYYGHWNLRPRDVANMTSYVADHTDAPLSWQVININTPVSHWLNSPILFISGNRDPKFTKQQIHRLKEYVDDGGLIYSSAVQNSTQFRLAMIKYAKEIVNNRYEFQQLSPKSKLLTMQPWFHMHMQTLAMSNGVRYLWIITPQDISSVWQQRAFSRKEFWELPINAYLYCTGKGNLGTRLSSLNVPAPQGSPSQSVDVGLLKFRGNWNPEPGAWKRMAKLAAADFDTQVNLSTGTPSSLGNNHINLVDLTGTGKMHFSPAQITALRSYLKHGGMLFANSAGGNNAFTNSFQNLVQKLYPHTPLNALPADCSIYSGSMAGGTNARHVFYRRFYIEQMGFRNTPALLGIKKNGRWTVIFSPQDITSGMLGTNTWGIAGYAPKSAVALTRNVIRYAMAH